jgi:hypothetical protein
MSGEMSQLDKPSSAEHERVFDGVFQFANVARIIVFHQSREHILRHADDVLSLEPVELRHEVLDQERDVFSALLQVWQHQADDVNAVKEVFAEFAMSD